MIYNRSDTRFRRTVPWIVGTNHIIAKVVQDFENRPNLELSVKQIYRRHKRILFSCSPAGSAESVSNRQETKTSHDNLTLHFILQNLSEC
jgi:hypothetical protein